MPTEVVSLAVSEGALERARLRAEYFAVHAGETAEVRKFRRSLLSQRHPWPLPGLTAKGVVIAGDPSDDADYAAVSPDVARTFLTSPVAALLEIEDFAELGRSIVDSLKDSSLIDLWPDGKTNRFTIRLVPRDGRLIERTFTVPASELGPVRKPWQESPLQLRRGSILDDLHWLGERLSKQFPWSPQEATWFVLTGEPPLRPLIETRLEVRESEDPPYTDARINLSIDATLLPEEVARHYSEVRARLLGGVRIRRAEARTLEIFQFVSARRLQESSSTWGDLVREWDQTAPEDWQFGGNEKAFQVYWRRGFRSVFPEFHMTPEPGMTYEGTPEEDDTH